VAFSSEDILVLAGLGNGMIEMYETAGGQLLRQFQGHMGRIFSLAFIPDKARFLSSSWDKTIKYWEIKFDVAGEATNRKLTLTGKCIRALVGHTGHVNRISISHDGQWIASASSDHTVMLWDNNFEPRVMLKGHDQAISKFNSLCLAQ
jgi:WD40 repeat protein